MSNLITLSDFQEKVRAWDDQHFDEVVSSHGFALGGNWMLEYRTKTSLFNAQAIGHARLEEHAINQLAERMGIPAGWVKNTDKCPPELRKLVFNWKFQNEDERNLMLRLRDAHPSRVRAVVSDKYFAFNHAELVDYVVDALQADNIPAKVLRPIIGDHLSAYILIEGTQFDVDAPQRPTWDGGGTGGLHPAVYISNNEIGLGRVRITGGLYRSYCKNGAIFGWEANNVLALEHRVRYNSANTMRRMIVDAIVVALNLSAEAAERMILAQEKQLPVQSIGNVVSQWASKYGIVANEVKTLTHVAEHNGALFGATVFDVVNLFTERAREVEDAKQRELLEIAAGDFLEKYTAL